MDEVFTYRSLVHAISGATGGITAITVFYPLNSARTRLQVSDSTKFRGIFATMMEIVEQEGVAGLYKGWWGQVVALGVSNFVYFYTYNSLKAIYISRMKALNASTSIGPVVNLAIASAAGVVNVCATTPLWVVCTRLAVQSKLKAGDTGASRPYTGVWDGLTRIAQDEGISSLWNGVGPSLVLVSNPSVQFVTYERVRRYMTARATARGYGITPVEFFVMGAIAKAVATVITYPLQVAQTRLRSAKKAAAAAAAAVTKDVKRNEGLAVRGATVGEYLGTIDVLTKLVKQDGFAGLYRGMEAKLWQTVLTAAFQFLTYEQLHATIVRLLMRDTPTPVAVAVATTTEEEDKH